ncbi:MULTISPECIES: hypothetical protein [Rathayibacter]|jgi:hypothetical protein|uniref:Uncharacterized protein n=2 Tax=Rathayibacter festucae TaxID=110937 RepID=A0A3Q9UUM9_9MICO|nr:MULTISPECIES: hypothetical protein [Rathayibacter]AZZ51098.1 hypothetical protein C1I64_02935 [Rathayibacter festucae DSM 15932]MCJ1699590.1 hypothetical protein [Rathayibacter festucae]MCJ1704904.1 hypothetical protein [Rathayibacter sp. VKM Ac-2926]QHC63475.1 hypothetical protein GSU69_12800 [Rathayibacter festucae]ROP57670.1 hypothetical protein EDF45_1207 [Rathayibacter sp. PhB186]
MSRPDTCAVLHRLVEVLEDPAPINPGHARHVSGLLAGALDSAPALRDCAGAPAQLVAFATEDPADENPAL